jgi:diguanylate cyclase (GGDEF)-like protein
MERLDPARIPLIEPVPDTSESEARANQLEVLNEIGRIATSDLELRPMLQGVTDALARNFDWEFVALISLDRDRGVFVCEAMTSRIETRVFVGYTHPIGSGVVGQVAATEQPVLIDDARRCANYVQTTPGVLSEICVPIKHKGRVVAVLNIESRRLGAFHSDLPLLMTVADQIAGAVAFARAYAETREWARLMEMLSEVSRTALEETNLESLLDRIARYIYDRFPLEVVTILLYEKDKQEFVQTAAAGEITLVDTKRVPVTRGLTGRCITTGKTQMVPDVNADPDYIRINPNVVSELAVPIRCEGEILGAINLESVSADVFRSANVLVFEAFADQVAGAIRMATMKRKLEQANLELQRLSTTDSLTGLANRRLFDERFQDEWRRGIRTRRPLSLLFLDVDSFKSYNDLHGHQVGDWCLRVIADTLRRSLQRATDFVARYGGEEFAVLLSDTDESIARGAAEIVRSAVANLAIPHASSWHGVVTVSVGCTTAVPDPLFSPELLMQRADEALYQAKHAGRNRVVALDPV